MAKDDYHVIVYQILAYLYTQLKSGEQVDGDMLKHNGPYFQINERYWLYIMQNMLEEGLIRGIVITKTWGKDIIVNDLDNAQITPAGIEYLCDNTFIEKAKQFLKDVKAIVPFV
jgi:hypothetical protein